MPRPLRSSVSLLALLSLAACAAPPPRPLPPMRPLGLAEPRPAPGDASLEAPEGPLTLRAALALALLGSPDLSAASFEVRAAEARRLQAGLVPNPEAGFAVENVGANLHGVAERTLSLSQLVELGGDRAARRALADREADLAGWDYEARRLDVLTSTAREFVAVLGAQALLRVAEESERIAGDALEAARGRAEAGAVSPVEVRRAEIEAATVSIDRDRAGSALAAVRARLAANWGAGPARFSEAVGDLGLEPPVPPLEALVARLGRNPDLARSEAEIRAAEAAVDAERAAAVPDVTMEAGRRGFEETGDRGFLFGVSVPLPLFDRRQGSIAAAEARVSAARARRRVAELRLRAELEGARAGLETAVREARTLRTRVVPLAKELLDATVERYRAGKLGGYLELLDARRTFSESSAREAEALADMQRRRIEIERLIAGSLEDATAPGTKE